MGDQPLPDNYREPWRCDSCGKYIYNTDENGAPAPGAPVPKWGDADHKEICSMCFEMRAVLSTRLYWTGLHNAWKAKQEDMQKNKNRLKPGEDYFSK